MSRTLRSHSLHYRRRGAVLDRINRRGRLFLLRLHAKYLRVQERLSEFPTLRRILFAVIAVLCISLVALGVAIRAANPYQPTDAEIWHNTVTEKKPTRDQKGLPDIHKMPERRYLNEQL